MTNGNQGSDHCPVFAVIKDTIEDQGSQTKLLDIVNPAGTFQNGIRQDAIPMPIQPRLCMKRFPEYGQRRSIKDMFSKMASNPAIPTRSSPSSSTRKREPQPQPDPPSKKLKQSPSVSKPRNAPSRDQKSLRGYFQPSASTKTPTNEPEQDVANPPGAKNETPPTTDQMLNAEIEEGGKTAPKSSRANWSICKSLVSHCDENENGMIVPLARPEDGLEV